MSNKRKYRTVQQSVVLAEKLAKKNNGKIPNTQWLIDHNYWPLYRQMLRYPRMFAHLQQERKIRSTYRRKARSKKKRASV
jgi:hypothetical protein